MPRSVDMELGRLANQIKVTSASLANRFDNKPEVWEQHLQVLFLAFLIACLVILGNHLIAPYYRFLDSRMPLPPLKSRTTCG